MLTWDVIKCKRQMNYGQQEIEGYILQERDEMSPGEKNNSRVHAANSKKVQQFSGLFPEKLHLFLESVVHELNYFRVDPADWLETLQYHLHLM